MRKKKPTPRKRTRPINHAAIREAARDGRNVRYGEVCRDAIKHSETDSLVRNLMAAGLAAGTSNSVLADDLTLLRWVLRKMEDNRRNAELAQIASEA